MDITRKAHVHQGKFQIYTLCLKSHFAAQSSSRQFRGSPTSYSQFLTAVIYCRKKGLSSEHQVTAQFVEMIFFPLHMYLFLRTIAAHVNTSLLRCFCLLLLHFSKVLCGGGYWWMNFRRICVQVLPKLGEFQIVSGYDSKTDQETPQGQCGCQLTPPCSIARLQIRLWIGSQRIGRWMGKQHQNTIKSHLRLALAYEGGGGHGNRVETRCCCMRGRWRESLATVSSAGLMIDSTLQASTY
jgi:hypothetical protein